MDKLCDILNPKTKATSKELNLLFKNTTKQKNHLIMINIFIDMRVKDSKSVNGNIIYNDVS